MALSLSKGATLSLTKQDNSGAALTSITLGLGWDEKKVKKSFFGGGGGEVDLDASAILFDSRKQAIETVYFGHLDSDDRSIHHTGDNLTGAGDGDDEQIKVELSQVSPRVNSIVLVITSYSGDTFDKLENVFARVVDNHTGQEIVRYNLAATTSSTTGKIVAKLTREVNGWAFTAIGEDAQGKTPNQLIPLASQLA